jgi:Ca-activated chloride channel family protein
MHSILDFIHNAFVAGQMRFFFHLPAVLFLAIPAIIWAYFGFQKNRRWRIKYPIGSMLGKIPAVRRLRRPSRHLPLIIRLVVISLVIVAAMRPQMGKTRETVKTQGIDIMLTLDISPSMLADDFKPTRVDAAKDVLTKFVARNQNDRMGLVVFSGMAFTQCPMTADTAILEDFISQVKVGDVLQDGTAIGDAILTAVSRFPDPNVPSRVIILTTDGENNVGQYDPMFAAKVANRVGVKIYTIGVGSPSGMPIPDPSHPGQYLVNNGMVMMTRLDEDSLRDIANLTGGAYFRAADENALAQIYDKIGKLEKHEIESHKYTVYSELYQYVLGAALIFLLFELGSRFIWGKVLP